MLYARKEQLHVGLRQSFRIFLMPTDGLRCLKYVTNHMITCVIFLSCVTLDLSLPVRHSLLNSQQSSTCASGSSVTLALFVINRSVRLINASTTPSTRLHVGWVLEEVCGPRRYALYGDCQGQPRCLLTSTR